MPRVLLNFQHYRDSWNVHFIEADCKTCIGPEPRFYEFATVEALRGFLERCNPADSSLAGFDRSVRAWGRGSEYVNLSDEQYSKLKR